MKQIRDYGLFCGMTFFSKPITQYGSRGLWFRIFGYGLHISTRTREQALFSERYGYRKALYLLGLRFEVLYP